MSTSRVWIIVVGSLGLLACSTPPGTDEGGDAGESTGDVGDGDGDPGDGDGDAALRPNWHQDIAPLVHDSCVGCHQAGGVAPMTLVDYESASIWAAAALDQIEAGTMPPWSARETERCTPPHGFVDDPTLPPEAVQMFADWVENATPEGDPADAVALPEPPSTELTGISGTFQNPSAYEVVGPSDDYVCFAMDLGLSETKYLDGVQMLPDNDEVVHHVLVWITEVAPLQGAGPYPCFSTPGSVPLSQSKLVAIWVPGSPPTEFPEGVSVEVPPGSHVVLAYHYHPPGAGSYPDRSSIALRWRDEPTPWSGAFTFLGVNPGAGTMVDPPFWIPAGASDHREIVFNGWNDGPVSLFSVATHMHYVGVDQLIAVQREGQSPNDSDCLVHTPAWDFNWQRFYEYDVPLEQMPTLDNSDTIWMDCAYDNTLQNPGVARALAEAGLSDPQDVFWGESTLDEMCVALLGVAWPG